MKEKNYGITLIALVITVILMLILAGVAITSITNIGIMGKIEETKTMYNDSVYEESESFGKILETLENMLKIKPYGDLDVTPSDSKYFTFTLDESTGDVTINFKSTYIQSNYGYIMDGSEIIEEIVIPYECEINGNIYDVTVIGQAMFSGKSKVKNIIIPNTINYIETEAFNGCTGLTSLRIPGSVTRMGIEVFENCSNLSDLTIEEGVTFLNERAFAGCSSLERVELPSTLKTIWLFAFMDCTSLLEIEIPKSVIIVDRDIFNGCTNLQTITRTIVDDPELDWDENWNRGCSATVIEK